MATIVQIFGAGRQSEFNSVAISPDGEMIAGGASDGCIWLWHLETGRLLRVLEGHTDEVRSVAWAPDGRSFASGSRDRTTRLWDPSSGKVLRVLENPYDAVWCVAWAPDGHALAGGSDRGIRLWDPSSGQTLGENSASSRILSLAWALTAGPWPAAPKIPRCASGSPLRAQPSEF